MLFFFWWNAKICFVYCFCIVKSCTVNEFSITCSYLYHSFDPFWCITQGPEVRSGDVAQPILLKEGQEFNFTIKRGVSTDNTVSVNYDDFINDVDVGDILLVDGK